MTPKPVVNLADVPMTAHGHGDAYGGRSGRVARLLGARKLGATVTEVPPGKSAWPKHAHRVNEEMVLVLDGTGTLHFGEETFPLRAGDMVLCPPGGAEVAHRIENSSGRALRYLVVSTMAEPEVVEFPDSGKFAVFAGALPGGDAAERTLGFFGRREDTLDYWDGE